MAKLVEDYAAYLGVKKGRARSPKHVAQVTQRVLRMLAGVNRLEDVTPEFIESRMHELLAQPVGGPRGKTDEPRTLSRHTVDGHRRELGTFFRWLQKKKKLVRENPVDQVDALDREEPRDVARAFSAAELEAFFQAVPEKRRLIYLFWATTGLRPQETRRIVWADVVLDGDEPPHIRLRCSTSKNQQRERQPLHPVMAAMLRELRAKRRKSATAIFEELPNANTFSKDLKKAGLDGVRVTPEGKLTAYSLRKTFITSLVGDEKNSTVAHKLARHSDPRLTFGTYTSFDLRRKAEAVANLPLPASVTAEHKASKRARARLQSAALPLGYGAANGRGS